MIIMLDAGHGGDDPGAVNGAAIEKNIALAVTLMIGGYLQNAEDDHEISYTRAIDEYPTLTTRCEMALGSGAEVFASIHCNSWETSQPSGFEVFTNPEADEADALASLMWNDYRATFPNMRGRLDLSDGDPDKESKFYVLVNTPCPAVLFELAFISNPGDKRRLVNPAWQVQAARSLAESIDLWSQR